MLLFLQLSFFYFHVIFNISKYVHAWFLCVSSNLPFVLLDDHNVDKDILYHHVQILCVSSNFPCEWPDDHNEDRDISYHHV